MKKFLLAILGILAIAMTIEAKPSLRGSKSSIRRQRTQAIAEGLSQIEDDEDLAAMKQGHYLVPLPENKFVQVDPRLAAKWRWCRPWTRALLLDLGQESMRKFGVPIRVNSAVRTVEYQKKLRRTNKNATAPQNCLHCSGATVDLARFVKIRGVKHWYPVAQQDWLRERLLRLESRQLAEAVEEHRNAVFHIMVFKKYAKYRSPEPQLRKHHREARHKRASHSFNPP